MNDEKQRNTHFKKITVSDGAVAGIWWSPDLSVGRLWRSPDLSVAESGDLKHVAAVAGASFQGEPSVSPSSITLTLIIFPWKWDSCSGHVLRDRGGSRGDWGVGGVTF